MTTKIVTELVLVDLQRGLEGNYVMCKNRNKIVKKVRNNKGYYVVDAKRSLIMKPRKGQMF